jgi:osmotically-inducible protein OsmY
MKGDNMNQPSARSVLAMLFSIIVASMVFPFAAFAQTDVIDLTDTFLKNGVVIDKLEVYQISDILLIRGKTGDRSKAEEAGRIATTLGYRRVANLIVVVDDASADAAIVYAGQRRLELEPALEGCRFHVDSNRGVIRLTGRVRRDVQGDLAVEILSKIDGVKEIHPDLARL